MEHYRYPTTSLVPDYLRVAFGLAITARSPRRARSRAGRGLAVAAWPWCSPWFGVRTALRQFSWVELSPADIALCGPIRRRLPWQEVRRMQLAYYAPRRARRTAGCSSRCADGAAGDPGGSTLDGFDDVLRRATGAAARNELALDSATQANLAALGLAVRRAERR